MGFIEHLQDIRSDDPYVVREAALALGRLGDVQRVSALVAAYDEGGFVAFQRRPQQNPARGKFGGYRDKVTGLAEALWMLGDPTGIEQARRMLHQTVRDGRTVLSMPAGALATENLMLSYLERGAPWVNGWKDGVDVDSIVEAYDAPRPAEWHPDPLGLHELRYWDGCQWTEHVFDQGAQSVDATGLLVQERLESFGEQTAIVDDGAFFTFVIDVSNVVRWRSGQGGVTRLADYGLIRAEIDRRWPGSYVRSIADASLRHRIRETDPSAQSLYEQLLASGEIVQAPAGTSADRFVIQEAAAFGGYMVTNDLYNKEGERELAPETVVPERFVKFHFAGDSVFLDTKREIQPLTVVREESK
ncbi:MAG: DUF2510 domain-containing protein [Coriobacteriales bacterium]|nr:DUF2510 domain-containing protein [Coriobacteriales bacterium]